MHQRLISASLLFVSTLLAQAALGGALDIEPRASLAFRYNDNPTLLADESDPDSTASAVTDFSVRVSQKAEDASLEFTPLLRRIEYFKDKFDGLSTTEYYLSGEITKQAGEVVSLGGLFDFRNVSVLTAEDSDPNDPNQNASATFLQIDDSIERLSANPYLTWNLSQIDTLTISGQMLRVDNEKRLSPRADYTVRSATIAYQRALRERHFVGLETNGSRNDTVKRLEFCTFFALPTTRDSCRGLTDFQGNPGEQYIVTRTDEQDFETFSGSLTYNYQASERLDLKAQLGLAKTNISQTISEFRKLESITQAVSSDSSFTTSTYLFSATYLQPKTDWEFELTRNVQPTSNGEPAEKTQARFIVSHRLTTLLSFELASLYYRETQRSTTTRSKNKYLRTDLSSVWRINRELSVVTKYIHRNRDPELVSTDPINVDNINLNRASNEVELRATYRF